MNGFIFDRVAFAWVAANGTKSWSFAEITDAHGETVIVECQGLRTVDGRERVLAEFVERLTRRPYYTATGISNDFLVLREQKARRPRVW